MGGTALFPLERLPDHLPTAIKTALLCEGLYLASFPVSDFASVTFRSLSRAKRIDWASRIVSTAFSCYVVVASFLLQGDKTLEADRLFSYTKDAGHLMGVALGYFLWDVFICTRHLKLFGPGFLVHALACLNVFGWILRPFLMYFGVRVLLWELSTPFLNAHWFLDKLGFTGTRLQLINGICLLVSYGCIRMLYGIVTTGEFFYEMISRKEELPPYIPYVYGVANLSLNALNVLWFSKMVQSVRARFTVPKKQA